MYPALAVLDAIKDETETVLWVGGEGGMEANLIQRNGIPYKTIPAAGIHGVDLPRLAGNLFSLAKGWLASRKILREFQPNALLFTGGYIAVPMALAARRYPSLLYIPDIEPGMALKFLARFARTIAVTTEETIPYLPGSSRIAVTGYPTRAGIGQVDKTTARGIFGLQASMPVLLVFGGSKGAHSINHALLSCLPNLLESCQVLHICGELDWPEVQAFSTNLSVDLRGKYRAFPYLHEEMAAALACADLAVCRAGASTLGELPLTGLPAILVPYPYAWRYQKVNAEYLVRNQAAVIVEDEKMMFDLQPTILDLIGHPEKLASMRTAMLGLAKPGAAGKIASLIAALASQSQTPKGAGT